MISPITGVAADAVRLSATGLDDLTSELTASSCFAALVSGEGGATGYRPTLREDLSPWTTILADAYDVAREFQGDPRRAYRG